MMAFGMCAAHARLIRTTSEILSDGGFEKIPETVSNDDEVRFW